MTGAEYIASFLYRAGCHQLFAMTGGAATFMIDAAYRHPGLSLTFFQHEQAAAMAADAVWRVNRTVGATISTSGPGATNLITGIASSFFDSIPSLHITGQVNQREMAVFTGANVRQMGFQETRIVDIVRPITKRAVMVTSAQELRRELALGLATALSGRMGPVLIDVPMDVQQMDVGNDVEIIVPDAPGEQDHKEVAAALAQTLMTARRPVVLFGAGIGLAGVQEDVVNWLKATDLPFVSSWGGLTFFDHDMTRYCGQIGVYGNRGANFILQNADALIVLGSRLDNRQRSNDPRRFAVDAVVHVLDVDEEELKKYKVDGYRTHIIEFRDLPAVLSRLPVPPLTSEWRDYVERMKARYFGQETSQSSKSVNSLSPYAFVRRLSSLVEQNAIVVGDTGAAVCWLHQAFKVSHHTLFTAGGNSPMGYALPAAIGAKLVAPDRQVISYNGDGGFQLNIQELQTIVHNNLDIVIIIMNNNGYGIIRQFQDSYLGSRYIGSKEGYSAPDFERVTLAYGLRYARVTKEEDLTPDLLSGGPIVIEVMLDDRTLIEPKMEMGRTINDQFPYLSDAEYEEGNQFVAYPRIR